MNYVASSYFYRKIDIFNRKALNLACQGVF